MTVAPKHPGPLSLAAIAASSKPSEHQDVPFLNAEQFGASAGHDAIAQMRAMLGRSCPAARWDKLSLQQRKIICYGTEGAAGIRPSTHAGKSLDEMTITEREAIRRSLLAIQALHCAFGGMLDRADFLHGGQADQVEPEAEQLKQETLERLRDFQRRHGLPGRIDTLTTQANT